MPDSSRHLPVIAAFDFDNTITNCDSLLPFLIEYSGWFKAYCKLAGLLPDFIRFWRHILSRQETKEKILRSFFQGVPIEQLSQLGKSFANQRLNDFIKPEAMKRVIWHQQQGHRCILVSAGIDVYLVPWGKDHGFSDVLCSCLQITEKGLVTGDLKGKNCWGPEKTRRLLGLLGPRDQYELYAYGDSRGDQELLEMADHPFYRRFE